MEIFIVTGFLGSGKTSLINKWLAHPDLEDKQALYIQTENGKTKPVFMSTKCRLLTIPKDSFDPETLLASLQSFTGQVVFIELNGFDNASLWINYLNSRSFQKAIAKKTTLKQIVHCLKAKDYDKLFPLMSSVFLTEQDHADQIYVTACNKLENSNRPDLPELLKAHINLQKKEGKAIHYDIEENPLIEDFSFMRLGTQIAPQWSKPIVISALLIAAIYILRFIPNDDGRFARLLLSFSGMLYQAFPFLLAGVLIASFVSVYVSENAIEKWFPKKRLPATVYGLFGGLLLPVCDCSIIPVSGQFLRKGVPANAAFTFMLAAPLVNPIAILSTWYAFPENHGIAIYRVIAALVIALIGGVIFEKLIPVSSMKPVLDRQSLCDCSYCQDLELLESMPKWLRLMLHAGEDFIKTAPYLMIGAFIAAVFQIYGSETFLSWISTYPALSLAMMMAAAFLLSVCSSSDAFIGRSLVSQFSLQSVMGFLVLGAMMDVKNMALLLRQFSAKQVALMAAVLFALSYVVVSVGNQIAAYFI